MRRLINIEDSEVEYINGKGEKHVIGIIDFCTSALQKIDYFEGMVATNEETLAIANDEISRLQWNLDNLPVESEECSNG